MRAARGVVHDRHGLYLTRKLYSSPHVTDNQTMKPDQWINESAEHVHTFIQEGDLPPESRFEVAGEMIENSRYSCLSPKSAAGLWGADTR